MRRLVPEGRKRHIWPNAFYWPKVLINLFAIQIPTKESDMQYAIWSKVEFSNLHFRWWRGTVVGL